MSDSRRNRDSAYVRAPKNPATAPITKVVAMLSTLAFMEYLPVTCRADKQGATLRSIGLCLHFQAGTQKQDKSCAYRRVTGGVMWPQSSIIVTDACGESQSLFPAIILFVAVASLFVERERTATEIIGFLEVIVMLPWIYLSGCVFIFGACLCAAGAAADLTTMQKRRGSHCSRCCQVLSGHQPLLAPSCRACTATPSDVVAESDRPLPMRPRPHPAV